ncbi:MAG: hypothetical protein HGA19_20330 [Oscillochloris sp.]|nr:hypothetical protein [Oscillochloris sp.]
MNQPSLPEQRRPYTTRMPLFFWLIWGLTIIATAGYTWWGALSTGTPLDIAQLVLRSLIVGLAGLIVLTLIEARMAPWRFLE